MSNGREGERNKVCQSCADVSGLGLSEQARIAMHPDLLTGSRSFLAAWRCASRTSTSLASRDATVAVFRSGGEQKRRKKNKKKDKMEKLDAHGDECKF